MRKYFFAFQLLHTHPYGYIFHTKKLSYKYLDTCTNINVIYNFATNISWVYINDKCEQVWNDNNKPNQNHLE